MTRQLTGVFGPVVTTFDSRGDVDLDAFGMNARAHLDAGLHGLVVCGSTGEAALLEESERLRLIEMSRTVIPSDRWLIAGTGAESTRACVRRCKEAASRGADAVLVVAPHYYSNAMTTKALVAHYETVAVESPIPVLLYNIPKYMHFRLEPELVATLARHPNIIGMKDSSGDMATMARYLEAQGNDFTVITGHAGTFHQALQLGARGGILAVALFAADLALEIYRAHRDGRPADAGEAQRRLAPMGAEIVGRLGIGAVKVAMERVGLSGGPVRLPLLEASPDEIAQVDALLRDAALVPA
ncbi:MAG: 4-hydroxy-tetrahydrodipicolinate synthase [Gemmatimonadaceae bacterium]|nr:4-hydroxy-tetrahydrodipicolinate synthase [Gemmatimonadaceae bacterium]